MFLRGDVSAGEQSKTRTFLLREWHCLQDDKDGLRLLKQLMVWADANETRVNLSRFKLEIRCSMLTQLCWLKEWHTFDVSVGMARWI